MSAANQEPTYILVAVRDEESVPLPGASITAVASDITYGSISKESDAAGNARLFIQPEITYSLKVSLMGFKPFNTFVQLPPGKTFTVEAVLKAANVVEE
jgi:hypothetical protein